MGVSEDSTSVKNNPISGQSGNLRTISLVSMISAWIFVPVFFFASTVTGDSHYFSLVIIESVLAVLLSLAWLVTSTRFQFLAPWIIILAVFGSFAIDNYYVAGLGIILGILVFIIGSLFAWQTLPRYQAMAGSILAAIAGLVSYFLDSSLSTNDRLAAPLLMEELLILAGGTLVLLFSITFLSRVNFSRVRNEITVSFIVIAIIPLWIVAASQSLVLTEALSSQANQSLLGGSNSLADYLDSLLTGIQNSLYEDTFLPAIIGDLKNPAGIKNDITTPLALRSSYILSYAILDASGKNLLDSHHQNTGSDEGGTDYFQNAEENKVIYISDIVFDTRVNSWVFYVSAPVLDELSNAIGVVRIEYSASFIQDKLLSQAGVLGPNLITVLVDENNIFLVHSEYPDLRYKTVNLLPNDQIAALQAAGRLPPGNASDLNANIPELGNYLQSPDKKINFKAPLGNEQLQADSAGTTRMTLKPWRVIVGQHASEFLAPVYAEISSTVLITIAIMLAVLFAASVLSNFLTAPINALAKAAESIGNGQLDTNIPIDREDEIGLLGVALQNTTSQLKQSMEGLETRVEERTFELGIAREKSEKQATQLRAIAEISRKITSIKNLDELLPDITQRISETLGFYHVGIFLIDPDGEYAVLRATNSEGGQKMLLREHRLKVGQTGIVGFVTRNGQARIALDVGEDAAFFNNPDLPNTLSEIALPLKLGEKIIGALDVQSTERGVFRSEDIETLNLLADQISIAIENARLFNEVRSALSEAQTNYRQAWQSSWREIASQSSQGFRFMGGKTEQLKLEIIVDGKSPGAKSAEDENQGLLSIPITIRGQNLGKLNIRQPGRDHPWTDSEIRLYQSIVERLSFALENARLLADSQRRAAKERVIGEISSKISASVDLENIMQTAAKELGLAIPDSEVVIQFQTPEIEK